MHNGRPKVTGARSAFDVHPFHVCRSRPLCYPPCASSAIAVPRVGSLSLVSCMGARSVMILTLYGVLTKP